MHDLHIITASSTSGLGTCLPCWAARFSVEHWLHCSTLCGLSAASHLPQQMHSSGLLIKHSVRFI